MPARTFLSAFNTSVLPARRMGIWIGLFFYGVFGPLDAAILPEKELYVIWLIRYLIVLPLAFLVLFLSFRNPWVQRHLEPLVCGLMGLCALSMILMVTMAPDPSALSHFMFGLLLVIFVGYSLFRLCVFWAGVTGALILAFFIASAPWMPMDAKLFTAYALQLFCAYVASMIGAFVMESASYKNFLFQHNLEVQRQKIQSLNEDLERRVEERTRACHEKTQEAQRLLQMQQVVERTLRMTEKQHRDLLEIVEDACFELDRYGRVSFFNTALCRISGRSAADIRTQGFFSWLDAEDANLLRRRMEAMGRTAGTAILSLSMIKPDGETLPIRLSLSPKEDGEAQIHGFRCVARDMGRDSHSASGSSRVQAPSGFSPQEHSAFLRRMAHSLRTPLNGLVGELHLLGEKGGEESQAFHLSALGEVAERMQAALEDMQDYVQKMEGLDVPTKKNLFPEIPGRRPPDPDFLQDASPFSSPSLRVLLAEDNLINQKITLKLLERKGYLPDLAENGLEVLEKLKTQRYDLILMDVQMPEMDGISATRRIREGFCGEALRTLPIVAFTAHVNVQDREACLHAGMNDVITKPAKPEALYAMVEKWGRRPERF